MDNVLKGLKCVSVLSFTTTYNNLSCHKRKYFLPYGNVIHFVDVARTVQET